jgi:hypothetical protein
VLEPFRKDTENRSGVASRCSSGSGRSERALDRDERLLARLGQTMTPGRSVTSAIHRPSVSRLSPIVQRKSKDHFRLQNALPAIGAPRIPLNRLDQPKF